jgi:hypothetical protein
LSDYISGHFLNQSAALLELKGEEQEHEGNNFMNCLYFLPPHHQFGMEN